MRTIASAYERMSGATCLAFHWIGQSFAHCDRCGQPYWEHSHDSHFVGGREKRVAIPAKAAEACRRKWGSP